MKKTVKIMSTILLAIMLVASIAGVVLAAGVDADQVISSVENDSTVSDTSKLTTVGANVVNVIQVVGIVLAIVILLVIGIKYMIGSAEEKAEYKKTMIPYIVGAVLIFAGTSIVKVVYQMTSQINVD